MLFLKKGTRGFTLIELLVVIAIIGILASIVLVSLNSARVKARNASRKADLRSIQLAQEMCYDDSGCGGGVGSYASSQNALKTANLLGEIANDPTISNSKPYHINGGAASTDNLGSGGATWGVCAQLEGTTGTNPNVFICTQNGCKEVYDSDGNCE